ncbi:hypothetical protein BDF14DRAFT_1886592 [Spinellus fusiger]|nr:hypothetical protein BDF14DRAFT_1886592 [Spinellus fusiger]
MGCTPYERFYLAGSLEPERLGVLVHQEDPHDAETLERTLAISSTEQRTMSRRKALERANQNIKAKWFKPGEWVSVKVLPKASNMSKQWERRSGPFQVIARHRTVYSLRDTKGIPLVRNYHGDRLMPYYWDDDEDSGQHLQPPPPDQESSVGASGPNEENAQSEKLEEGLPLEDPNIQNDQENDAREESKEELLEEGTEERDLEEDLEEKKDCEEEESSEDEGSEDEGSEEEGSEDEYSEDEYSEDEYSEEEYEEEDLEEDPEEALESPEIFLQDDREDPSENPEEGSTEQTPLEPEDAPPSLGVSLYGRKRRATEKMKSWRDQYNNPHHEDVMILLVSPPLRPKTKIRIEDEDYVDETTT